MVVAVATAVSLAAVVDSSGVGEGATVGVGVKSVAVGVTSGSPVGPEADIVVGAMVGDALALVGAAVPVSVGAGPELGVGLMVPPGDEVPGGAVPDGEGAGDVAGDVVVPGTVVAVGAGLVGAGPVGRGWGVSVGLAVTPVRESGIIPVPEPGGGFAGAPAAGPPAAAPPAPVPSPPAGCLPVGGAEAVGPGSPVSGFLALASMPASGWGTTAAAAAP